MYHVCERVRQLQEQDGHVLPQQTPRMRAPASPVHSEVYGYVRAPPHTMSCCSCLLPQISAATTAASAALRRPRARLGLSSEGQEQLRFVALAALCVTLRKGGKDASSQ